MKKCSELQVGDWVLVHSQNRLSKPRKVEKLLSKHIIVEGIKYRKLCGFEPSRGKWDYNRSWISPASDQEVAESRKKIRKANIIYRLKNMDWSSASEQTLEAAYDLIKLGDKTAVL